MPLTTFDGAAGPEDYKISKDADVTVLAWDKSEVKSNVAVKGKLDQSATKKIVAAANNLVK